MNKKDWVWMPHAAHFICRDKCRFHLATYVGGYIVSTVGEYLPDSQVRDILAKTRGVTLLGKGDAREVEYLQKIGFEEVGCDRLYETMVFHARRNTGEGSKCCPWIISGGESLELFGCNDSDEARMWHMKMCSKYAAKHDRARRKK